MKTRTVLLFTCAGLFALLWLIPLIWLVVTAFTEPTYLMTLYPQSALTLGNIKYVLTAAPFGRYYINTIMIVIGTYGMQFLTVTLAAYALGVLNFRLEKLVFFLIFVQIIIPNDVLIMPNYSTMSFFNLVDTKLAIMLPFYCSAFGILLLRQSFKTIPKALKDASMIDGCNTMQTIWGVYVPCAKPAYVSFGLVSISYHWNNYLWPMIVTNSVENRPLTVGLAIFAKSKEAVMQWSNVTAATFIIILPLLLAFLIYQKQFINSFVSSGIK
ncbi:MULTISPECIES: carbohydrate ABC transporter permease [unclassified Oceanispirochaeta]|uniref:carbohydrate ABC transporter permease n=1 Tax=unclassified Oceanispirochaeta TaxID=2635722 RepID=UPI000E0970C3|nr:MULTISPECIES: carbohydrate ABC transporter permease [unclassified Oceanispirochaeta]MBF9016739.1 carbohydrate ABC transporter permease [Oceanispirochaeta sp. M2]NPD72009.1 carbohydrate ABC transporter permease [Oceanispirochaeta sp. M1]RDG32453.1 carbohydrate ABC transporter permease [Oceanispirochaeta sp. M1]